MPNLLPVPDELLSLLEKREQDQRRGTDRRRQDLKVTTERRRKTRRVAARRSEDKTSQN